MAVEVNAPMTLDQINISSCLISSCSVCASAHNFFRFAFDSFSSLVILTLELDPGCNGDNAAVRD